jgi:tRNA pseudouridine32 synthase / 23S rRNA pseudouridine746 synthase
LVADAIKPVPPGYSKVTVPWGAEPYSSILEFLVQRFARVPAGIWKQRIIDGKIISGDGSRITLATSCLPGMPIFYAREVEIEPVIPFAEKILFRNDDLVVACKPHFLPVHPTGRYVAECLVNRLRKRTGNEALVPVNRIDRETAGLVLLSANPATRGLYCELFRKHEIEKEYETVAEYAPGEDKSEWVVENRIVKGEPWFRMRVAPGESNSRSIIRVTEVRGGTALFALKPVTGKTHQLRLHMSGLGFRILNDRYYPELQPESEDDFEKPLQLVARRVRFKDPVTGKDMEFVSARELQW